MVFDAEPATFLLDWQVTAVNANVGYLAIPYKCNLIYNITNVTLLIIAKIYGHGQGWWILFSGDMLLPAHLKDEFNR